MSVTILTGDCRAVLATLPADSVHCIVTSPPYWGLRDYGTPPQVWGGEADCAHLWGAMERGRRKDLLPAEVSTSKARLDTSGRQGAAPTVGGRFCQHCGAWSGELGQEPSLGLHIEHLVGIFRQLRRVLRPDGVAWVNYGDCYATSRNGRAAADTKALGSDDRTFRDKPFDTAAASGLPSGNLCLIPERLAIALQDDGWVIRKMVVWGKRNGMPDSSGRFRPGSAHERIWLLSRKGSHYWDAKAVRFQGSAWTVKAPDGWDTDPGAHGAFHRKGREKGKVRGRDTYGRHSLEEALPEDERRDKQRGHSRRHAGFNERWDHMSKAEQTANGRHLRDYEPDLSSFSAGLEEAWEVWDIATRGYAGAHFATFPPALIVPMVLAGCPAGGMVLDPFGGSGTTGLVAEKLGRNATLIELNGDYATLADSRLRAATAQVTSPARRQADEGLFGLLPRAAE